MKSQKLPLRYGRGNQRLNVPVSNFTIIPVPFESTVSYGRGTKKGPAAILRALEQVETFDHEFSKESTEYYSFSVAKKITKPEKLNPLVRKIILEGKIPVILGGEHSIAPYVVEAVNSMVKDLTVLQIDAHADLRNSYKGNKNSHACAMRRTLEIVPVVQVGIRNISKEGYAFAKKTGQLKKIHFLDPRSEILDPSKVIRQLSDNVYITLDVDGLDPSIMPATGTPEPGGLLWNELLSLVRAVAKKKKIVGFDVMELAPIKGLNAPNFTLAKFIYKLMNYICFCDKISS